MFLPCFLAQTIAPVVKSCTPKFFGLAVWAKCVCLLQSSKEGFRKELFTKNNDAQEVSGGFLGVQSSIEKLSEISCSKKKR